MLCALGGSESIQMFSGDNSVVTQSQCTATQRFHTVMT
jgi:hypothetical protein